MQFIQDLSEQIGDGTSIVTIPDRIGDLSQLKTSPRSNWGIGSFRDFEPVLVYRSSCKHNTD